MRALAALVAVLVVGILTGCGNGDRAAGTLAVPGAPSPGQSSFEARCAALPAAAPEATALPITPTVDETRSLGELTLMYERASPLHRTMGLTQSRLAYASTLDASGLREGARVCMRVKVHVAVEATPLTVYLAREIAADPCLRHAVHEHEMRHVAAYDAFLREAPGRLVARLAAADVGRVRHAGDADALQQDAAREIATIVSEAEASDHDRLTALQAVIDTPEEYARVSDLCATTPLPAAPDGMRGPADRR